MATKYGRQSEKGFDHVTHDITPNSPKSSLILSATTRSDLWSKMAAKYGRQSENNLGHITDYVELSLIARGPTWFSHLQQNVTFDPRWLRKMATN